jgi:hypothetical protein
MTRRYPKMDPFGSNPCFVKDYQESIGQANKQ